MKLIIAFSLALLSIIAKADTQVQLSVDYWQTPDQTLRYQPNYSTVNAWQPTFASGKIASSYDVTDVISVAFKARYNQIDSGYIDQASIGYHSDTFGLRGGILPYRITWCETYDFNSVWAREPDAYCSFRKLSDSASGAFGVQAYKTFVTKDWAIDTQLSLFNPTVLNQSDTQGGIYVSTGSDIFDKRYGASVNLMHLKSSSQLRIGWIRTHQLIDGVYPRDYSYDTLFGGIEFNPIDALTIKVTRLEYLGAQNSPAASLVTYISSSTTLSAVYEITDKDKLGIAYSQVDNRTIYLSNGLLQPLSVPSLNISYRRDFMNGIFLITQYVKSSSYYQQVSSPAPTELSGSSLGVKLGINF